jgi:hypothetical protein
MNQDKVIKIETIQKNMCITLGDGTKLPTKGKVINTYYQSGRKDCKVVIDRPLALSGKSKIQGVN